MSLSLSIRCLTLLYFRWRRNFLSVFWSGYVCIGIHISLHTSIDPMTLLHFLWMHSKDLLIGLLEWVYLQTSPYRSTYLYRSDMLTCQDYVFVFFWV